MFCVFLRLLPPPPLHRKERKTKGQMTSEKMDIEIQALHSASKKLLDLLLKKKNSDPIHLETQHFTLLCSLEDEEIKSSQCVSSGNII